MTAGEVSGLLHGAADDRLGEFVERLDVMLGADPDLSFQVAAYHHGALVLDVVGGPHLAANSITVPFSATKNTIGLSIGVLIDRGLLDLDATVASYWPEFATKGKQQVTVRQLLSHQVGLLQTAPALSWFELFDHHAAAERLAASRPFWQPGSAFGYHAFTIGNLSSELVFRVTGRTLHDFYEQELRAPLQADFYLGLPPELEQRRVDLLPVIRPEFEPEQAWGSNLWRVMMGMAGTAVDLANDPASWRFGHPAGSGTGTARGLAKLLAGAVTGIGGAPPLLSADTVEIIGQQQVHGYDQVLAQPGRAHSIIFQKPTTLMPFGGPRAFGHDGAAGAFASADPDTGLTFAYTIARGPWPGGGDPRAIILAADLGSFLSA